MPPLWIPGQGGIINAYYQSVCQGNPCSFSITFGNPGANGVGYCLNAPNDRYNTCIPDGNEFKGQNPDVRPPPPPPKKRDASLIARGGLYKTENGMEVRSNENLKSGTVLMMARETKSTLVGRDTDWGDGDEWDDPSTDPPTDQQYDFIGL